MLSPETRICVLFVDVNEDVKFKTVRLHVNAAQSFALKHLSILCSSPGPPGATQGPHFKICCFKAHGRLAALHEPKTEENRKYV